MMEISAVSMLLLPSRSVNSPVKGAEKKVEVCTLCRGEARKKRQERRTQGSTSHEQQITFVTTKIPGD